MAPEINGDSNSEDLPLLLHPPPRLQKGAAATHAQTKTVNTLFDDDGEEELRVSEDAELDGEEVEGCEVCTDFDAEVCRILVTAVTSMFDLPGHCSMLPSMHQVSITYFTPYSHGLNACNRISTGRS